MQTQLQKCSAPSVLCVFGLVEGGISAAAFQHNARTLSGPPSTGITVTMDGGVADTAHANTTALTPAVNRRSLGKKDYHPSINARTAPSCCCCSTQRARAHGPRTPKHGGRYRYGRGHGLSCWCFPTQRAACARAQVKSSQVRLDLTRAHTLRTPKHGNHSHHGRRCGRHSPC